MLEQKRGSPAGYLENAYWYVSVPPGQGATYELVRHRTTVRFRADCYIYRTASFHPYWSSVTKE